MNECQASVGRRAKARVDLGGEQVDMLLPRGIVFGRSQVSWKFWWCLCDGEHDRKESQGGRMGDGVFFFFFFSIDILPSFIDFSATMCNRIPSHAKGEPSDS